MLLTTKTAVIYGAAGATGAALARAFAREGGRVYVTGRRLEAVAALAREIGGEAAVVDALDERAVEDHLATLPRVDISYNAMGIPQQGIVRDAVACNATRHAPAVADHLSRDGSAARPQHAHGRGHR
jgi:NADP-dependent 3-hydroxy acid dehydrogenase YdfG